MSQACARWRGDIGAYIVDALDRDGSARLRRHMQACAACWADYEDLLPVREGLSRLATAGELADHLAGRPSREPGRLLPLPSLPP